MTDSQPTTIKQNKAPLYISVGIAFAVLLSYLLVPLVQQFINQAFFTLTSGNEQKINQWVAQFGVWGPIAIVVAMIVQMFLVIIPSPILIGVAVLSYGIWWGSLIAVIAIVSASTVGYIIGAYLGPPFVTKMLGTSAKQKVEKAIDRYGFWAVVVARLNPFLSDDAISFVTGVVRMGYWKFMGATLIGVIPLTLLIGYLGENSHQLKEVTLWVGIISLASFIFYIWWNKKIKKNV